MTLPELAIDAVSVVVRGAYKPAIFSPAWLMSNELIGSTEYEAAQVEIISPQLSAIQADWLRLNVDDNSFTVSTADPTQFERTRDVAIGILQALKGIPISVMGINREVHFQVPTLEQWHAIGDTLAPKEFWSSIKFPGLIDLTIVGPRSDEYAGRVQAQVQPSVRVKPCGVYVSHNDHYGLRKSDSHPQTRDDVGATDILWEEPDATIEKVAVATVILSDEWEDSMRRAEKLIEEVAGLAKGDR